MLAVMLQKNNERVIKISATAAEDLRDIWEYVSQFDESSATKLLKEIDKKFILLRANPLAGREQYKYLLGLRSFVAQDYLIFYLPLQEQTGIEVLRVLHTSRDIEKIFQGFFDTLPNAD